MTGFEKISDSALRCFKWLILDKEAVKDYEISETERRIIDKYSNENTLNEELDKFNSINSSKAFKKFTGLVNKSTKANKIRLFVRVVEGIAAAAVISIALILGGVFRNGEEITLINKYAQGDSKSVILITSEGKTYSTSGDIKVEENKVVAARSELISVNADISKKNNINELITPKGVRQKVILPDGSVVWLNSESSLMFPSEFDDTARVVKLTGEAYFDVVKSDKTFIVKIEKADISVYGTTFNVSSYKNSLVSNVSLYSGSVGLRTQSGSLILTPGYYAEMDNTQLTISEPKENFSSSPDWIRGRMEFVSQPLYKVFEVIGRWYNIDYELLSSAKNLEATIVISDKTSLNDLIELLEMTQNISIERQNNKLIIEKNR